jgi:hypothetical protein
MEQRCFGYADTPIIPGTCFRVHDGARPQPRVVSPGAASAQEQPGDPPSDTIVLFDGTDLSQWASVRGGATTWKVKDGYMEIIPGTGDIRTQACFGDCQLYLEWVAPAVVKGEGQEQGNSGVLLVGSYGIQVLDGYENPTYADGTTAAIYGQYPPLVNACRRPGEWQCYDIIWTVPRFDGDQLLNPAYVTVLHNGIVVHNHTALLGPTQYRRLVAYRPHPPTGPLQLQDHGARVRYRNIWYRPVENYDQP